VKYLTPQDILVIHARVIDKTGGSHGVRDTGLLVSLTERPKSSFGGKEVYSDLFQKAAVCLESLIRYHVFIDGNKRTAFVGASRFLFLNGFEFTVSNKEAEDYVLKVAIERYDIEQIAEWLKANSRRVDKQQQTG
jgi:death on curing protein